MTGPEDDPEFMAKLEQSLCGNTRAPKDGDVVHFFPPLGLVRAAMKEQHQIVFRMACSVFIMLSLPPAIVINIWAGFLPSRVMASTLGVLIMAQGLLLLQVTQWHRSRVRTMQETVNHAEAAAGGTD